MLPYNFFGIKSVGIIISWRTLVGSNQIDSMKEIFLFFNNMIFLSILNVNDEKQYIKLGEILT